MLYNEQPPTLGGKAKAQKIRDSYDAKPNKCLHCNLDIKSQKNKPLAETKAKKFCNCTCAAQFNNKLRIVKPKPICVCGKILRFKTKYCRKCVHKYTRSLKFINSTKEELFGRSKNWQSARSSIRRYSTQIIKEVGTTAKCEVCGYTNHVEVAHIKSVSSFPGTATIKEICHIDNLCYLCPNHHWEYDNNLIILRVRQVV